MYRLFLVTLLLVLWGPASAVVQAEDPKELERTWLAAWVFLPEVSTEGYRQVTTAELPSLLEARETALPAIVFAHSCSGHFYASNVTGAFLAKAGFLVVMPDSFARENKPTSCIPAKHLGGLHRAVLGWRQAEMAYAIARLQQLPEIRKDAIFLMGFSEGGITTATFTGPPLAGRIVEGWTCHAGWGEYRGLRGPKDEPLLTLVAAQDPWFRLPVLQGDCGAFMADRVQSRSLVVAEPPAMAKAHWLTKDKAIQAEVLAFLKRHLPE